MPAAYRLCYQEVIFLYSIPALKQVFYLVVQMSMSQIVPESVGVEDSGPCTKKECQKLFDVIKRE